MPRKPITLSEFACVTCRPIFSSIKMGALRAIARAMAADSLGSSPSKGWVRPREPWVARLTKLERTQQKFVVPQGESERELRALEDAAQDYPRADKPILVLYPSDLPLVRTKGGEVLTAWRLALG
jgi:hypothetical protein